MSVEVYIQCDWCRIRVRRRENLTLVKTRWRDGREGYTKNMELCKNCAPSFLNTFPRLNPQGRSEDFSTEVMS
jgi:hypothetical protein